MKAFIRAEKSEGLADEFKENLQVILHTSSKSCPIFLALVSDDYDCPKSGNMWSFDLSFRTIKPIENSVPAVFVAIQDGMSIA